MPEKDAESVTDPNAIHVEPLDATACLNRLEDRPNVEVFPIKIVLWVGEPQSDALLNHPDLIHGEPVNLDDVHGVEMRGGEVTSRLKW